MGVVDYAWAAGFLDGEGTFLATPRGSSYQPQIAAAQVVPEPIERLHALLGGTVQVVNDKRPQHRPYWRWGLWGATAVRAVVPPLLPHLTTKRREAELLLALAELILPRGGRACLRDVERRHVLARSLLDARRLPCAA